MSSPQRSILVLFLLIAVAAGCSSPLQEGPLSEVRNLASLPSARTCSHVSVDGEVFLTAFYLTPDLVGDIQELALIDIPLETSDDVVFAEPVMAIPSGSPPGFFLSSDDSAYRELSFVELPGSYDAGLGLVAVGVRLSSGDAGPQNSRVPAVTFSRLEYSVAGSDDRYGLPVVRDHWISRSDPSSDEFCTGAIDEGSAPSD